MTAVFNLIFPILRFESTLLSWAVSYFQDADTYKLGHPSNFHYLNQSKVYELEGVSSAEEYVKTRRAMDIVGINNDEQVFYISTSIVVYYSIAFQYLHLSILSC